MSAFEYITIPVSIVLALGLGKVLSSLMLVIEKGKRDWLHLLWCVVLILVMLGQWLAVWSLQANEIWNAPEFYLVMISPILLYTTAHVLISSQPESIASWSSYLESIARPLLLLMTLTIGNFWLRNFVILGSDTVFSGPAPFALLILHVVAIVFPKRWLLAACGIAWFAPILVVLFGIVLLPVSSQPLN